MKTSAFVTLALPIFLCLGHMAEAQFITVGDGKFIDPEGRQIILHGVNIYVFWKARTYLVCPYLPLPSARNIPGQISPESLLVDTEKGSSYPEFSLHSLHCGYNHFRPAYLPERTAANNKLRMPS